MERYVKYSHQVTELWNIEQYAYQRTTDLVQTHSQYIKTLTLLRKHNNIVIKNEINT